MIKKLIGSVVVVAATAGFAMASVNVGVSAPGVHVQVGTPSLPQVRVVERDRVIVRERVIVEEHKDNGKHKGHKKHKGYKKHKKHHRDD